MAVWRMFYIPGTRQVHTLTRTGVPVFEGRPAFCLEYILAYGKPADQVMLGARPPATVNAVRRQRIANARAIGVEVNRLGLCVLETP